MKIKDLPDGSRPRERFLKFGAEALGEAELFAILLRTGSKGENVIDMANRLIFEYGLRGRYNNILKNIKDKKEKARINNKERYNPKIYLKFHL
jgi:DNA repair protein RadC